MNTGYRPVKRKICRKTGKASYGTRKTALTALVWASAQLGKALRAYKCEHCRRWHLTSKVEPEGTR